MIRESRALILRTFKSIWRSGLVVVLVVGLTNFAQAESFQCRAVFTSSVLSPQGEVLAARFAMGLKNFEAVESLARELNGGSPAEKETWVQAAGEIYRQIPKKNPNPLAPRLVGGRRLLDRLLSLVESYDRKFASEIAKGLTGQQSYNQFMRRQQQVFGIKYGEPEVSVIIDIVQNDLRTLKKSGAPAKILLAGSFINGKASMKDSDVDVSVNDKALLEMTQSWAGRINESLRLSNPEAKLTIETHGEPAPFYGKLNPVVIEITAEKVEILIFPPSSGSQEFNNRAAEPLRYPY